MTTVPDGRRTLPGGTRPLDIPPFRRYRGGRARRLHPLVRDFLIIFTTWAVTAWPILWISAHLVGPALFEGAP